MTRSGTRYQPGNRKIDSFAEALSQGLSIRAAAESIGISQDAGKRMFQRIRKGLGWQAQ